MTHSIGIIYGTSEGQAEKIAGRIARKLGDLGIDVETYDAEQLPSSVEFQRYDGLIVGASIHAGSYPKSIARFIRNHHEELEKSKAAFFSVSLTASDESEDAQEEIRGIIDGFLKEVQWQPQMVESFAGAIPFSRYGFVKRSIMKLILRGRGEVVDASQDYEYTDWDQVDRFAESFGALLETSEETEEERPAR